MPLHFAYGSNMDQDAMAARCPGSRVLGPARLAGHRLVVMREGYLSVARDPRRYVAGLLWDVALADLPALDRYEGVGEGLYVKRQLPVLAGAGPRWALVYVGTNSGPGLPRPGYLEDVLAAARDADLPESDRAAIAALGGGRLRTTGPAAPPRVAAAQPAVRPRRRTPLDAERARLPVARRWEP